MDEQPAKKPKGGRPLGSKNKIGDRTAKPNWLRDLFCGCFTRKEYEDKFKGLTDAEQFALMAKVEPRAVDLGSSGVGINLIINGIRQTTAIDGSDTPSGELPAPPRALPAYAAPVNDSREKLPYAPAERCDELTRQFGPRPVKTPAPEPEPVKGPIFTVPSFENNRTPKEWLTSMEDLLED